MKGISWFWLNKIDINGPWKEKKKCTEKGV